MKNLSGVRNNAILSHELQNKENSLISKQSSEMIEEKDEQEE
jgi:hypothetical protein